VRNRLEGAVIGAMRTPQVREQMDQIGFEVVAGTGSQFEAFLRQEISRWRQVVQTGNIKAD
jgi:tripartite-type tricarboxylate transporter receptor subunit TctC